MKGLIHIYTGNGKGKTTAALGLGIRAYGRGFKVLMVQFLKGTKTGEMDLLEKLSPGFQVIKNHTQQKFTWEMNEEELDAFKRIQQELFQQVKAAASAAPWDMIILDEIMAAITSGFIDLHEVIRWLQTKDDAVEIVMTGRNAPKELVELSHYVSEIHCVKHPMDQGIPARKGIEM